MAKQTWSLRSGRGRLLIGIALVVSLSGCGSADPDDGTPDVDATSTASTTASPSETATETATPETAESETDSATPAAPPFEVSVVSDDRTLSAVVASTAGEGTEEVAGKIIIAERGCLHLTNRSGAPTLLVFPPGADIDTTRRPTLLLDGARYPVGRPVRLTGETVTLDADQISAARPCVARAAVFRVATVS